MELSWKRNLVEYQDTYESYRGILNEREAIDERMPPLSQLMEAWQDNPELITEALLSEDGVSESYKNVGPSLANTEDMAEKLFIYSQITKLHLSRRRLKIIPPFGILKNLVVLDLSLNHLVVLENFDSLIKLEFLDLGYNKIEKIQGLNKLVSLRVLNLKMNKIIEIEGLDNSTNLSTLNIASNRIYSYKSITYLRKFKSLTRLNMENNPVSLNLDGDRFLKAMVPQVQCYNYQVVSSEQRKTAFKFYKHDVLAEGVNKTLRELDEKESIKLLKEMKEKSETFVEKLEGDYLFMLQFENNTDGQEILKLCGMSTKLGTSVNKLFSSFKRGFMEVCKKLYEYGKDQYVIRRNEITEFESLFERQKLKVYQEFKLSMNTCRDKKIEYIKKIMMVVKKIQTVKAKDELFSGEREIASNFDSEVREHSRNFNSSIMNENEFQKIDDNIKEIIELLLDFKKKNKHLSLDRKNSKHEYVKSVGSKSVMGHNKRISNLGTNNNELDEILQVLWSIRFDRANLDYITSYEMFRQLEQQETISSSNHSFRTCCLRDRNMLFSRPKHHDDHEMRKDLFSYNEMDESYNEMGEQMFDDWKSDVSMDVALFIDYKDPKVMIECMLQRVKDEAEQLFSEFDLVAEDVLREEYRLHENLKGFSNTFFYKMSRLKMDFWIQIITNFDILRKQATEFSDELTKLLQNFYKHVENKNPYRKHPELYKILSDEEAMFDALMNSFGELMDVLWGQQDELTDELFAYLESIETKVEEEETSRHHMMYTKVDNFFKSCKNDVESVLKKLYVVGDAGEHAENSEGGEFCARL